MAENPDVPPDASTPALHSAARAADTASESVKSKPPIVGNPNPEFLTAAPAETAGTAQRQATGGISTNAATDPAQTFQRLEALIDGLSGIARAQLDATQRLIPPVQELSGMVAMSNARASGPPAGPTLGMASAETIDRQLRAAAAALPPVSTGPSGAAQDRRPGGAAAPCACDDTCPECQCVSSNCCCFNIMLHRIRVTSLGGLAGVIAEGGVKLELQVYAYVPGVGGVLYPSLGGHVMVQGKLESPGSWAGVNVLIVRVCIPKGQTKSIPLHLELKESDKIFKDDIGSGSFNIVLNCCCNDINVISHEVGLTQGDGGKAVIGLEFRVEKVC